MTQKHFSMTIGSPRIIHPQLIIIGVQVDLQSLVIFHADGEAIGWIHEATKHIEFSKDHEWYLDELRADSYISDRIIDYTTSFFEIDGNASTRKWCVKTKFIYPPIPDKPITIETEEQY